MIQWPHAIMKKKYLMLGSIAFLLLFACCVSSNQYMTNRCLWWDCAPKRNFHVLDWEVPANLLPEGVVINHISTPSEGHGEIEGGGEYILVGYSGAGYLIYRFPTTRKAISDFNRIKKRMVDPETGESWQTPSNSTFSSPTASDLHMACGHWSNRYRCETVARYQEYVLFYSSDIDDVLTFVDYEKILFYIDEQISSRLYP